MSEIEKIQRYIDKTHFNFNRYKMDLSEMNDLLYFMRQDPARAILLAFKYGRAKGYRAAKAGSRRCKETPQ